MAGDVTICNNFKNLLATGQLGLNFGDGLQLRGLLFDDTLVYIPSAPLQFDGTGYYFRIEEINIREVTGPGYVSGGEEVTGVSVTQDPDTGLVTLDGNNLIFPAVTLVNVRYLALYLMIPLAGFWGLGVWDLVNNQSPNDADFEINWNPEGILSIG